MCARDHRINVKPCTPMISLHRVCVRTLGDAAGRDPAGELEGVEAAEHEGLRDDQVELRHARPAVPHVHGEGAKEEDEVEQLAGYGGGGGGKVEKMSRGG